MISKYVIGMGLRCTPILKLYFSSSKLSEEDERKRSRRLRLGLSPTIDESGNNRDSIGAASDQSGSSEEATTESPPTSPPKQSITPPNEPDVQRPTSRTDVKPDDEPEIIVSPGARRRRPRPDQRPNVPYHMQTKQSDVDSFYDMPKTNHEDNLNAETALWKREEGAERQLRPKADSLHEPDSDLEATRNALEDLESEIADLRVTPDPTDPVDESEVGFPEPPSAEKLEESLLDASKTDELDFFYKKPSPVGDPDELNDDATSQDDSHSSSRPETPSTDQTEKNDTNDLPSGNVKDKLEALNKMALESKLGLPPKPTEETTKPERPKTAKQEEKSDSDCFWDKLKTEISNNMYVGDVDFRKVIFNL